MRNPVRPGLTTPSTRRRLNHPRQRYRNYEFSPAAQIGRLLSDDLIGYIPRQDDGVIWHPCEQLRGRQNRHMRAGQEQTLLMGAAVNGKLDHIPADCAVVQKGVSLGRRAVSRHPLTRLFYLAKRGAKLVLERRNLLPERRVASGAGKAVLFLFFQHRTNPAFDRTYAGMLKEDSQRAAVDRLPDNIPQLQARARHQISYCAERIVENVLVVDRVEFNLVEQIAQIRKLERRRSARFQTGGDRGHK